MSVAGPLFAVGLAFVFAGLFRVLIGPGQPVGVGLMALGAGMMGAAYQLFAKGV
jgi:hypothetical protein